MQAAAQGLHGLQAAAQGLHGLQAAAQGLQGLQAAAQGLQGLQAASCTAPASLACATVGTAAALDRAMTALSAIAVSFRPVFFDIL